MCVLYVYVCVRLRVVRGVEREDQSGQNDPDAAHRTDRAVQTHPTKKKNTQLTHTRFTHAHARSHARTDAQGR